LHFKTHSITDVVIRVQAILYSARWLPNGRSFSLILAGIACPNRDGALHDA